MHKLNSSIENKSKNKTTINNTIIFRLRKPRSKDKLTREEEAPSMSTGNGGTHAQVLSPTLAQENSKN